MDLSNLMGMFGDMQSKMETAKAKLDEIEITEKSNGIEITVSASKKVRDISIDASLLNDKEELEDMLLLTLSKALERAEANAEMEMQKIAGGMLPPGLF